MNYEFLKSFITNYVQQKNLTDARVCLSDLDGYLIYGADQNIDNSTIALIAGVYQGARKLYELSSDDSNELPALSLGRESNGLFIKSLKINNRELLLSGFLKGVKYPSRYKMYLNLLVDGLVENYPDNETAEQSNSDAQKEDFLFEDISDNEVDALFSGY